jgi:hydrophobe/amphiphile efflux-1 (HAE1) family protein/NodT family efflux transporter outer membrane factor (OMF) lipoprotein
MNFSGFFIQRPIFAGVLSALIFLVGLLSLRTLPVSEYPEVVPPTVVVRATYPGANPRTVSETVAAPLEQAINGVENSLYMFSQATADGVMTLTVTFKLGTDVDLAQVQVQNRVAQALPKLPEEVRRLGVTTIKSSPDLTLVIHLFSPDERFDEIYIRNYASLQVKDVLARLPGVGQVELFGSGDYAMRIWLDPERCAARGLTAGDVVAAIREQNVQVAGGAIGQQPTDGEVEVELQIDTKGRLLDEQEFGQIVVKQGPNGEKVLLSHVARLELGAGDYSLRSLINNQKAVALPIFQLPGSNAIEVSEGANRAMEELKASFPEGLDYAIVYDPTVFVRHSIEAVVHTLLEAVALVVLVVIVFLQTWRASLIPLAAVPVSLVGTFAVMHFLGFGINALTLFGLVLAIGIVVDDAIVVVENVERNIALGLSPMEATRKAMGEVTGPIVATALVLAAVFIPTAFISGLSGQFYKQFAITIAISTAISAFNSLTLSPALSALLLKSHHAAPDRPTRVLNFLFGWFFRPFNRGFAWASERYGRGVTLVIRKAAIVMVVYLGLLGLSAATFQAVPTGFIPTQDKQYLVAVAELPAGASIDRTDEVIRRMSEVALAHPGVANAIAFPGLSISGFTVSANSGIVFLGLDPFEEREAPELSGLAIAGALNGQLQEIQEAQIFVFPPPAVMGLGTVGGFKLFVEDRASLGYDALFAATQQVLAQARQTPELSPFGYSGFEVNVPQLAVDVDRIKAKTQGVPLNAVFETLQVYLGSLYVNDFNLFGRTYQVVAQADAEFRNEPADIERLRTRNEAGEMVQLASVVEVRESYGPNRVMRYNGYPAADVNGGPAPGHSSGEGEAAMAALLEQNLPNGLDFEWTDLTYQKVLAGNSAVFVFPLSILLVFLVLAAQYESFRLPLAVILIVPLTVLSAFGGVWLADGENNIFTQIGLIVLIGLAAKNAILIVEFAKAKQDEGLDPAAAAIEAARLRLRPILMTSIAFIAGVYPLVVSSGAGSEMRQAMGLAVFSGMIGVTFFGLVLTPVFYSLLMRLGWRRRETDRPEPREGDPALPLAPGPGHGLGHGLASGAVLLFAALPLLGGCAAVGPDYQRPELLPVQASGAESSAPEANPWRDAAPQDELPRGNWWTMFGDPELDALQARAAAGNTELQGALARLEQARALTRGAKADRLPSVDFTADYTRTRYSPNAGLSFPIETVSNFRVPLHVAYELDLFGRVRRAVEAGERDEQARAAALQSLLLALHAEVAANHISLRVLDAELELLDRTAELRRSALELAQVRSAAGRATDLDVARAEAELATTEAERLDAARRRSELATALAVLLGEPAQSFERPAAPWIPGEPPAIPAGLPSDLLERRPDVAAAERLLAADNARIGVARAAHFPRVRLTGFGGYEAEEFDDLFDWSSRIWQLAPGVSLPLFQGGRLRAEDQRAQAAYEESLAAYRGVLLQAFREVQDGLTATRLLAEQAAAQAAAEAAAERVAELARIRYDAGFVSYLDVVEGERSALEAERQSLRLAGQRHLNAVFLVRALGGGWDAAEALPEL